MNEFKVLTVHDISFTDDRGKEVTGMHLWVIGETADKEWNGWEVVKIWIPDGHALEGIVASLKHDDVIFIEFNRRGKPQRIDLVE